MADETKRQRHLLVVVDGGDGIGEGAGPLTASGAASPPEVAAEEAGRCHLQVEHLVLEAGAGVQAPPPAEVAGPQLVEQLGAGLAAQAEASGGLAEGP